MIGPGAIGCAFAAALIEAGHDPQVVGRAAFDHLLVRHRGGSIDAPLRVVTDAAKIQPTALVILATKAMQVPAAAEALGRATAHGGVLVVAQNGLGHHDRVAPFVGPDVAVIPAVVMLPAERHSPGTVDVTGRANLILAESAESRGVEAAFAGSFLEVTITEDWTSQAWMKLIANASLGAIGVLVRRDNGYLTDPDGRDLTLRVMAEIVPIALAEGAILPDNFPQTLLAGILDRANGHTSSIVTDRIVGMPTEWRERNAIISELGRKHGLPTPLNDMLTSIIRLGEPDRPDE
ncbi:MAG: 2-dehydropantoate 2-reductase [Acidimicrobiales bacterium]